MVGSGQAGRAGPDHQHALARRRGVDGGHPAQHRRHIAEEALDGMDTDRGAELVAVARAFAGMVADPAMHGRHRVVAHQHVPGLAVLAGLRQRQPGLDILAGRTGVVARRQQVLP